MRQLRTLGYRVEHFRRGTNHIDVFTNNDSDKNYWLATIRRQASGRYQVRTSDILWDSELKTSQVFDSIKKHQAEITQRENWSSSVFEVFVALDNIRNDLRRSDEGRTKVWLQQAREDGKLLLQHLETLCQ